MRLPLKTERLVIRRFTPDDWRDLHEYLSDPDVVRFEPYDVHNVDESRNAAAERAKSESMLAVCLGGKMIGNIYFGPGDAPGEREIGYVFNRAYWGKGYAYEAANAVIQEAFASGAARITAGCAEQNPRSWRLLERLGMTLIEKIPRAVTLKRDEDGNDIWLDARRYGISRQPKP